MKRYGNAVWYGAGKNGEGNLTTQTNILNNVPYTFKSRFEEGHVGTNPEELIAAAHAGCFSMKLSIVLEEAGFFSEKLETKCDITLENGSIKSSHLSLIAKVPGISDAKFIKCVNEAKENCPVSKALNIEITIESMLDVSVKM